MKIGYERCLSIEEIYYLIYSENQKNLKSTNTTSTTTNALMLPQVWLSWLLILIEGVCEATENGAGNLRRYAVTHFPLITSRHQV